ncbi:MAG: hypothetical protein VW802_15710 [Rhodospirillaceae bacterium]
MKKSIKTLAVALTLVTGLAAAPAIYADESSGSQGSKMGSGMMGQDGMMGQGNMMGMMGQMNQMMATCNKMMKSMMDNHGMKKSHKPGHKNAPSKMDKNG